MADIVADIKTDSSLSTVSSIADLCHNLSMRVQPLDERGINNILPASENIVCRLPRQASSTIQNTTKSHPSMRLYPNSPHTPPRQLNDS